MAVTIMMKLDVFLEHRLESEVSRAAYRRVLEEIGEATPEAILTWWKGKSKLSPISRRTYAMFVSSYLRFLSSNGDQKATKLLKWFGETIRVPQKTRQTLLRSKRFITEKDFERLYAATEDPLKQLALEVLWKTGVRVSTMLSLSKDSLVENQGRKWIVFVTKGKKEIALPCPSDLYKKLSKIDGFTWRRAGFHKFLRNLGQRVLGKIISAHDFRRGRITHWYNHGVSLVDVSKLAGHSSVQITADIYIQPDTASLFKAMNQ